MSIISELLLLKWSKKIVIIIIIKVPNADTNDPKSLTCLLLTLCVCYVLYCNYLQFDSFSFVFSPNKMKSTPKSFSTDKQHFGIGF